MLLYGLLIADGVLLLLVLIAATIRFCKKTDDEVKEKPEVDEIIEKQHLEAEALEEEQAVEPSIEPVTEEPVVEEPVTEEVKEEIKEEVAVTEETLVIGDIDEGGSDKKGVPFSQKMLSLEKETQDYYDVLNNAFLSLRRMHGRVSQKGVSYRLGRDLVGKITVRGKTLRLNLALETKDFEESRYFQKDMRDVKSYQDVPFMVKVKSDRGLKRALELIDALIEKEKIERKARYFPVDSIENLKSLQK